MTRLEETKKTLDSINVSETGQDAANGMALYNIAISLAEIVDALRDRRAAEQRQWDAINLRRS